MVPGSHAALDSEFLEDEGREPASRVSRARGPCRGSRSDLATASAGDVVGSRGAQGAPRCGGARRCVLVAGRRLCGVVRRLQLELDRDELQDPSADESAAGACDSASRGSRGSDRGAVRQAAFEAHRRARREGAALVPRRPGEPLALHRGGSTAGPDPAATRLRARCAHAELRARIGRRWLRGPSSSRKLGRLVR